MTEFWRVISLIVFVIVFKHNDVFLDFPIQKLRHVLGNEFSRQYRVNVDRKEEIYVKL